MFIHRHCCYNNVILYRYAKVVEAKGGDGTLVANAKQEIAQSFAEFWLFKIETELNAVNTRGFNLEVCTQINTMRSVFVGHMYSSIS